MRTKQSGFGFLHLLLLSALLLVGVIGWNSYQKEQEKKAAIQAAIDKRAAEVKEGLADIEKIKRFAEDWDAARQVAGATSRIALAQPVTRLQEIKRQVKDAPLGLCVSPARESFVEYMEVMIEFFIAFMADSSTSSSTVWLEDAAEKKKDFNNKLRQCKESLASPPSDVAKK